MTCGQLTRVMEINISWSFDFSRERLSSHVCQPCSHIECTHHSHNQSTTSQLHKELDNRDKLVTETQSKSKGGKQFIMCFVFKGCLQHNVLLATTIETENITVFVKMMMPYRSHIFLVTAIQTKNTPFFTNLVMPCSRNIFTVLF